jgi:hypothetical protein
MAAVRRAPLRFDRLVRIARGERYVASADGFFGQPAVSDLFAAVLGEKAGHARCALSPSQLPANATVEWVVTAQMAPMR